MTTLTITIDGASRGNPGPSACAAVFRRDGVVVKRAARAIGKATNNEAEYRALLGVLRILSAVRQPDEDVVIQSDSQLVVKQVNGEWSCRMTHLLPLLEEARYLIDQLASEGDILLCWIPRTRNSEADILANYALDKEANT